MTIVPIGKINLQVKLHEKRADYLEEVEEELGRAVKEVIKSSLERLLEAELEHMLRRAH
jgi:hypothetical protein